MTWIFQIPSTRPTRHSFFTRFQAESMAHAESQADAACRTYFGDAPYALTISTTTIVRMTGEVIGYEVSVDAEAVNDRSEGADHDE